jgi:hypothetical protein
LEKENRSGKHSLPGTNQAGKTIGSCEEGDQENTSGVAEEQQDQLEEHSLPGTNQAGKRLDPGPIKSR